MPPIYDYECPNCGHRQEEWHSIKESPDILCKYIEDSDYQGPIYCNELMKRVITGGTGFLLKGPGWTGKIKPST